VAVDSAVICWLLLRFGGRLELLPAAAAGNGLSVAWLRQWASNLTPKPVAQALAEELAAETPQNVRGTPTSLATPAWQGLGERPDQPC